MNGTTACPNRNDIFTFEASHVISVITPFILLHAFANGTTALTGVGWRNAAVRPLADVRVRRYVDSD